MHRNHRRKDRHRSVKGWLHLPSGYCRFAQRLAWKRARQDVRQNLLHERYEAIQSRYPLRIRWDYW